MKLDPAHDRFTQHPTKKTAGAYLAALMEYEADDMIGDDTFLDGLAEIRNWLQAQPKGRR